MTASNTPKRRWSLLHGTRPEMSFTVGGPSLRGARVLLRPLVADDYDDCGRKRSRPAAGCRLCSIDGSETLVDLFCVGAEPPRAEQPRARGRERASDARAVEVAQAQICHGGGVASLGSEAEVVHSALKVNGHAAAVTVGSANFVLRPSVALLGGLAEAATRLGKVLLDTPAIAVEYAEVELRNRVSEVRSALIPGRSSSVVLGEAAVAIFVSESEMSN